MKAKTGKPKAETKESRKRKAESRLGYRRSAFGCPRSSALRGSLRPPTSSRSRRRFSPRWGITLLEVMLAIAILGLSLATMGELVRLGTRAAAQARDLTMAQILCEGKMSELAAGVIPPEPVDQAPFELEPEWTYTVAVAPLDQMGLLAVTVTVQPAEDVGEGVSFTLTRWLIDPLLEQPEDSETLPSDGSSTEASASGSTPP